MTTPSELETAILTGVALGKADIDFRNEKKSETECVARHVLAEVAPLFERMEKGEDFEKRVEAMAAYVFKHNGEFGKTYEAGIKDAIRKNFASMQESIWDLEQEVNNLEEERQGIFRELAKLKAENAKLVKDLGIETECMRELVPQYRAVYHENVELRKALEDLFNEYPEANTCMMANAPYPSRRAALKQALRKEPTTQGEKV